VSRVTVLWLFVASACLTLAVIHLMIGLRRPSRTDLLFAWTAVSGSAIAVFELGLMRAQTPEGYGSAIQWMHVALFSLVTSIVLFVRNFLAAGSWGLAGATIATRAAASLVVNFVRDPNLNFVEIRGLRRVPFLGESVAVADGVVSAWTRLGEASSILFLLFLASATAAAWRRGDRRRALAVGGSAIFCVVAGAGVTALVHAGVFAWPYLISIPYFGIVVAMSYELTSDVLRASELSRRLVESEETLRERNSRIRLAAVAANLGYWAWDLASGEVWLNQRGRQMLGFSPGDRIDLERFLGSVHPDDREQVRRSVLDSFENGREFEREFRILRGGEARWITSRGAAERDRMGKVVRVLGVSIDTTRRKAEEMEAQLKESELAHLSRVAMLGEFSGSLAHELNQPLTAILSNAQAAQRFLSQNGGNLEELQAILRDIVAEDKRAGEVIRRLRLLLKKGEIDVQRLDLVEVVEDVLKLLRGDLESRGVSVRMDLPEGLPPVRGDRVQIQQVFVNLIANACDAMSGDGAAERRILLSAGPDAEEAVRVSVSDTGPGIPPADLDRVFEPFVTSKPHGMGLGLSVCRTILAAHGGRLWASNNAAGGAAFHFTLPAAGAGPS
jgi:PAS domain S-box-containing protein